MNGIKIRDISNTEVVVIDTNMYSLAEVQASAYLYTEFASFNFKSEKDSIAVEIVSFPNSDLRADDISHLFKNQLFMESLRTTISKKTEIERNLILAYAFSNTPLVG
ncbi:hypothetical protein ACRN9F_09795 [Shewanella oncorhynchi]|uniref:His-Xaa-Ser system protein HxsD n=1 Tax=Shewanella septentrionalis TaxID=2952223 RepID=A0A9X3ATM7_9GAMM|nr:hypothetical protein [Shewanella septentrionalis]MCT7945632.1 hypothetical protein [Shewanella septentrionalis]